jgi:DNA excision repair protein ERCC-3
LAFVRRNRLDGQAILTTSHLIFQRDESLLVTPGTGRERIIERLRSVAQLRRVVAGSYVFEIAPVAIWASAARGQPAETIIGFLDNASASGVPATVAARITELHRRYGALWIEAGARGLRLVARDAALIDELGMGEWVSLPALSPSDIAAVKQTSMRQGWPVCDAPGTRAQPAKWPKWTFTGRLRPYQEAALSAVRQGGSGLVLLPCGAGKTTVGIAAAGAVGGRTLILAPSRSVAEQWRAALLEHTTLDGNQITLFAAGRKLAQVTIATYHAATIGLGRGLLLDIEWDLVVYDEVQSLPAASFRLAAAFQASRRLGLTATLVREDGRESEIFALVGPPLYDASWQALERAGWIAPARCIEVRLPETDFDADRLRYKLAVLKRLLAWHEGQKTIVASTDLGALRTAGTRLGFPVLTGDSDESERSEVIRAFRDGELLVLGMSRIGTVGIDVPDASVLVQLTGTFGSRQEEAQRLGRILRPQPDKLAWFYTLVANGTPEVRHAERRQRFLVNQGYVYEVRDAADLPRPRHIT